jgi:hypothetical protein
MKDHLTLIEIEASTLDEARNQLKDKIGDNCFVISEEVDSYGGNRSAQADAESVQQAFLKAEKMMPKNAVIIDRKEICASNEKLITVDAFSEESAKEKIKTQIDYKDTITNIKTAVIGSKGVFGIGKKPNTYEISLFKPAKVEISYCTKAKITVKIGRNTRNSDDTLKLDRAVKAKNPIEVVCENCGKHCKALPEPLRPGTIMTMTPEIAIIASRYCEKCNIVICGACVGVSLYETGLSLGGRCCPKCSQEITFAAVPHLRMTGTKLL